MKKEKSFTLVELLVVIAILGLLSSIVLVSLRGTRQRASIASGEQFSSSLHHSLGAYAIGIWNFDDSGDLGKDSSGNGNDGTPDEVSAVEGKVRGGGGFNGSDSNIEISDDDGSIASEMEGGFTIESWFNSDNVNGCCPPIMSKGGIGIILYIRNSDLLFYAGGRDTLQSGQILEANRWQHVAVSCDGHTSGSECTMFFNGKEIDNGPLSRDITLSENILIGEFSYGQFDGILDEVRLYGISLSSAQIWDNYAEGAKRKGLTIEK